MSKVIYHLKSGRTITILDDGQTLEHSIWVAEETLAADPRVQRIGGDQRHTLYRNDSIESIDLERGPRG